MVAGLHHLHQFQGFVDKSQSVHFKDYYFNIPRGYKVFGYGQHQQKELPTQVFLIKMKDANSLDEATPVYECKLHEERQYEYDFSDFLPSSSYDSSIFFLASLSYDSSISDVTEYSKKLHMCDMFSVKYKIQDRNCAEESIVLPRQFLNNPIHAREFDNDDDSWYDLNTNVSSATQFDSEFGGRVVEQHLLHVDLDTKGDVLDVREKIVTDVYKFASDQETDEERYAAPLTTSTEEKPLVRYVPV